MTVHLLCVNAHSTPDLVNREARKLAMTGGFEIEVERTLSPADVSSLTQKFSEALKASNYHGPYLRASNCYRVLRLLQNHPNAQQGEREFLSAILQSEATS